MLSIPFMVPITGTLPEAARGQGDFLGLVRRLEGGGVLLGKVLRPTLEGTTPIQIGKLLLPLILTEELPPGTTVRVRSEGGKILVEPREAPASQAAASGELSTRPNAPPTPAGQPQAAASPLAQLLSRALQANNLPAQLETLQVLQTALGNIPPEQAPVLALLLARNVPITPENLLAVREKLRARGNLGRELGQLSAETTQFLATGSVRGSDRLAGLLVRLQDTLAWNQTGDLAERVERLRDFLSTFEEKLLGNRPDKARSDFKAMVLELDFLLAQAELPQTHPLRASAWRILNLIEGAQLTGLTQVAQPDKEAWVFWRIPFPGEPSPTTVELAVRGERDADHPERYNPRDMELLLQVELSVLGPVRVRLRALFEQLRIILSVAKAAHREFLVKEVPLLVESLKGVGFDRVEAEVRVEAITPGSLAEELDPLRDWERRLEGSRPSLDIRL
ncbi:MAG: hypothetical protein GHCLOJNM_04535 [bacterium]|nr:hypothetical protein [bacterium]